jgi:hypothetical protein
VAVECLCTWSWLADRCADAGLPFGLGQALSMQAIHGGKATNDPSDSPTMAARRRGGRLPQASVSPAQRRATRDLRRRRMPLAHQRAELLAHVHNTPSQSPLPASGTKLASTAHRAGGAARWAAPAVPQRIAVDRALIPSDAALLRDVALPSVTTARPHAAHPRALRHTVPGIGTILRLVRLDDRQAITRFPRGQDCRASCRLVQCAQAAAGTRWGPSGATSGQAHLTGAFAEAAVLCLRDHAAAPTSLARLEKKQDQGQAWTIWAPKVARAVYDRLHRQVACEREKLFHPAGRGAEAPAAARDHNGKPLTEALDTAAGLASVNAKTPLGPHPRSPVPVLGPPLSLLLHAARGAHGRRGRLLTRAGRSLDNVERCAQPLTRTGGGHRDISRSPSTHVSLHASPRRREHRKTCVGQPRSVAPGHSKPVRPRPRLLTTPGTQRREKTTKTVHRGRVSLDNRGPHTG